MTLEIRPERSDDFPPIRAVNEAAFGRPDEGNLVDALRSAGCVQLSLIAQAQSQVVGHILFSDLEILGGRSPIAGLALAPMAVLPARQRQGVGSTLVRAGLQRLKNDGHRIVIVLGHPKYYPRFGFSAQLAAKLSSPYAGESFMALELVPGALLGVTGEVRYPEPFGTF